MRFGPDGKQLLDLPCDSIGFFFFFFNTKGNGQFEYHFSTIYVELLYDLCILFMWLGLFNSNLHDVF